MATKAEAQTVKVKLEGQYPNFQFGLGKNGDDWTVELRDTNGLTIQFPRIVDGVTIRFRDTGSIKAL